eukprot:jgi/Mesvir1/18266/Mv09535-RA.1
MQVFEYLVAADNLGDGADDIPGPAGAREAIPEAEEVEQSDAGSEEEYEEEEQDAGEDEEEDIEECPVKKRKRSRASKKPSRRQRIDGGRKKGKRSLGVPAPDSDPEEEEHLLKQSDGVEDMPEQDVADPVLSDDEPADEGSALDPARGWGFETALSVSLYHKWNLLGLVRLPSSWPSRVGLRVICLTGACDPGHLLPLPAAWSASLDKNTEWVMQPWLVTVD